MCIRDRPGARQATPRGLERHEQSEGLARAGPRPAVVDQGPMLEAPPRSASVVDPKSRLAGAPHFGPGAAGGGQGR
eukprot:7505805-Alexandrium_andersonii.AAC.1